MKTIFQQSFQKTNQFFLKLIIKTYNIFINILLIHKAQYMLSTLSIVLLALIFFTGACLGILSYKLYDLSDIEGLDNYSLYEIPSTVYDINGKLFKKFSTQQREIVSYENIPQTVIETLLTAEDRDFFQHKGVNPLGILRALIINVMSGHVVQGGSTLTQQLAKLLFTNRERNIQRKIKELLFALQIEKKFTKEEILEKYLNKVYYANGVYSIAAASRYYFNTPLQKINFAQAAMLISIPPNPTFYNPLSRPINVKHRQSVIMRELVKAGKIDSEEAERQTNRMWEDMQTKLLDGSYISARQKNIDLAPYFSEYIRRILYSQYGDDIYTQGYKIYTTIDIDLQTAAQESLEEHITNARKTYKSQAKVYYNIIRNRMTASNPANPIITEFLGIALGIPKLTFSLGTLIEETKKKFQETAHLESISLVLSTFGMNGIKRLVDNSIEQQGNASIIINELEGAMVSTEAKTGRILAMVGGSGFSSRNQINRVYQTRRQPGSVFKPFVYLSALNSGRFTPATIFDDKPIAFELPDGSIWAPGNSGKNYQSQVTLRDALRRSINIISVKLLQLLGIGQSIDFISNLLGLEKSRFRFDSSLALGTSELSPLELNKGYAIIANGGQEIKPHGLIMVKNRYNQVVYSPEDNIFNMPPNQLVDPRYNYIITTMLQDVFKRGTATKTAVRMKFPLDNIAGKTGTSSNMSDSWFSGFTSKVATTVWIGFDQRATLGNNAFGAVLAEPIWIDYMKEALKKYPNIGFVKPYGVVSAFVHKDNGLLMPSYCYSPEQSREEFFTEETLPRQYSSYCGSKLEKDIQLSKETIDTQDIFASLM